MENLKLISIRIEPDTLRKIDSLAIRYVYWKRNAVINQLLTAIVNDMDEESVYDMLRRGMFLREPVLAKYKILEVGSPMEDNDKMSSNTKNSSELRC